MMKNKFKGLNIYKGIWVSCIFLFLIVVLVMIMDYKINYEYLEEKVLYFYNCDGEICTTEVEASGLDLYSKYECRYDLCPKYEKVINNDYVLLSDEDGNYELYNYKSGEIVSAGYDSYYFIDSNYIVVAKNGKQGIIDVNDNVVVKLIYDEIGCYNGDVLYGYNLEYIVAKKDDKYGIISFKTGEIKENFSYSETKLEELLLFLEV